MAFGVYGRVSTLSPSFPEFMSMDRYRDTDIELDTAY